MRQVMAQVAGGSRAAGPSGDMLVIATRACDRGFAATGMTTCEVSKLGAELPLRPESWLGAAWHAIGTSAVHPLGLRGESRRQ